MSDNPYGGIYVTNINDFVTLMINSLSHILKITDITEENIKILLTTFFTDTVNFYNKKIKDDITFEQKIKDYINDPKINSVLDIIKDPSKNNSYINTIVNEISKKILNNKKIPTWKYGGGKKIEPDSLLKMYILPFTMLVVNASDVYKSSTELPNGIYVRNGTIFENYIQNPTDFINTTFPSIIDKSIIANNPVLMDFLISTGLFTMISSMPLTLISYAIYISVKDTYNVNVDIMALNDNCILRKIMCFNYNLSEIYACYTYETIYKVFDINKKEIDIDEKKCNFFVSSIFDDIEKNIFEMYTTASIYYIDLKNELIKSLFLIYALKYKKLSTIITEGYYSNLLANFSFYLTNYVSKHLCNTGIDIYPTYYIGDVKEDDNSVQEINKFLNIKKTTKRISNKIHTSVANPVYTFMKLKENIPDDENNKISNKIYANQIYYLNKLINETNDKRNENLTYFTKEASSLRKKMGNFFGINALTFEGIINNKDDYFTKKNNSNVSGQSNENESENNSAGNDTDSTGDETNSNSDQVVNISDININEQPPENNVPKINKEYTKDFLERYWNKLAIPLQRVYDKMDKCIKFSNNENIEIVINSKEKLDIFGKHLSSFFKTIGINAVLPESPTTSNEGATVQSYFSTEAPCIKREDELFNKIQKASNIALISIFCPLLDLPSEIIDYDIYMEPRLIDKFKNLFKKTKIYEEPKSITGKTNILDVINKIKYIDYYLKHTYSILLNGLFNENTNQEDTNQGDTNQGDRPAENTNQGDTTQNIGGNKTKKLYKKLKLNKHKTKKSKTKKQHNKKRNNKTKKLIS